MKGELASQSLACILLCYEKLCAPLTPGIQVFDIWNLKISLQAMFGNLLSLDIPLCVKFED